MSQALVLVSARASTARWKLQHISSCPLGPSTDFGCTTGSSVPAAIPLACQAAQATPQQPVIIISPAAQQRSPEAPVHSKASHLRSRGHNPGSPAHPQAPAQQERQQPPPLNPTRAQSGNPAVETAGSGSRSRSNVVQSSNAPEKGRAAGPQAGAAGWPPGQGGAPAMLGKEGASRWLALPARVSLSVFMSVRTSTSAFRAQPDWWAQSFPGR